MVLEMKKKIKPKSKDESVGDGQLNYCSNKVWYENTLWH